MMDLKHESRYSAMLPEISLINLVFLYAVYKNPKTRYVSKLIRMRFNSKPTSFKVQGTSNFKSLIKVKSIKISSNEK